MSNFIKDVLLVALMTTNPTENLKKLVANGMMEEYIPEFMACVGNDQQNPHHHLTIDEHIYKVVEMCQRDEITRLSAFFHDIGKPVAKRWVEEKGRCVFYGHDKDSASIAEDVMTRLGYDVSSTHRVSSMVLNHMKIHDSVGMEIFREIHVCDYERMLSLMYADISAHKEPRFEKYYNVKRIIDDSEFYCGGNLSEEFDFRIQSAIKNKVAFILMGVPRSGKTTVRNRIKELVEDVHVSSADDIRIRDFNVRFDSSVEDKVWNTHTRELNMAIRNEEQIIIDNTNCTRKSRVDYIKKLRNAGYKVVGMEVKVSYYELMERAKKTSFPKKVIMNMLHSYQNAMYSEGFDNIYKIL